jgi:acylpyruvate hydrolase
MQRASTAEMIFPVAELISYISSFITLMPGDLIATGTPAGIGAARQPAVFLKVGTKVRTAIEGLGEQVNTCSAAR